MRVPLTGPLPSFNFLVVLIEEGTSAHEDLAQVAAAGFTECSGLESEIQTEDRLVGGVNDRVFRFPTRAAYTTISLSRGVGLSEDLYLWHAGFLRGEGVRRNGLIFLADAQRVPVKAWQFENAIPTKWVGPALDAGTSATAIERLEIVHEKLTLILSPGMALDEAVSGIGGV